MSLIKKYMAQTRKPKGFLGKIKIKRMNASHAKLAAWGRSTLPEIAPKNIAELGCGGGMNIRALLDEYKDSFVSAIDYSPLSVAEAKKNNKGHTNRCEIMQDDVSKLSLEKDSYDLATAFETVYFWPGIKDCFTNVYNILKKGGYFLIVNELSGDDKEEGEKYEALIEGLKVYSPKELEDALYAADFSEVKITKHDEKPWFTIIAKK